MGGAGNGAEVLDDLREVFERYLILPEHGSVTMALWVMHAWTIDAAHVSPFLMFSSPEMRCGKSTAMALLSRTAPRSAMASNISPAAIFRYIEAFRPTLLIDEANSFAVENDELRGILNSGHTRDTASVIRLTGDDHEPKDFSTWAPKAIASIGKLANTLRDRSIILSMQRKKAGERVAKLRAREADGEFLILRRKAKRWAADNIKALTAALPEIPRTHSTTVPRITGSRSSDCRSCWWRLAGGGAQGRQGVEWRGWGRIPLDPDRATSPLSSECSPNSM